MNVAGHDLLKRISSLVKQIQDVLEDNENLKKTVSKLSEENENLKATLKSIGHEKLKLSKKYHERSSPLRFEIATVLFGNIYGFDNLLGETDTQYLVDELDEIRFQFGLILQKYNIHKIKTIGDSFMAAGGIPVKNITNPIQIIMAALEIQDYLNEISAASENGRKTWEFRLGIHTGPVTATVMGKKKVSYDIKGDTVNIASRMESYSKSGKVLISGMTYELVKEIFICEYYGKMPVKYKSDLDMYLVKGLKSGFSLNGKGIIPNNNFHTKFKLVQFTDIQEIILEKLEKELASNLYYHNVKHTVDVVTQVELIGWAEGLSDHEILLLKTAALFHDAGHINNYEDHEYQGTVLARKFLPSYGYSEEEINRICEIIMATKMPPQPKDLLGQIICDADLDYLGRTDMIPVSNTLYKELKEQNKISSFKQWNIHQLNFLTNHQYFTETAQTLREVNKQTQIERIKRLIEADDDE